MRRAQEQADAYVYAADQGGCAAFCVACARVLGDPTETYSAAYERATWHLWSTHSLRRVWVDRSDPRHASMVNVALPLVIAHNTTRAR